MLEKITKYKKYIISVAVISLLAIFLANIKYLLPKKYGELPEVKLREIKNSRSFAIMIPNESGDGYVEYNGDTWPSEEYAFKEAKCIDNNGNEVNNAVTFADGKAILETDKTVSCTLYFDKFVPLNLRTLCENYDSMQTCIEQEKSNTGKVKALSNEPVGGMYRYQGIDKEFEENESEDYPVVENNYICFGINDSKECTSEDGIDKYMYRIIGINETGSLYLIKSEPLVENNNANFAYNNIMYLYDCVDEICEYPNSSAFKRMNGISNGIEEGIYGDTNIFVNSERYNYMTEENDWYKKILNHKWLYGDIYYGQDTELNGEYIYGALDENYMSNGLILYDIETGIKPTQTYDYVQNKYVKHQWSDEKSVTAKIGLMYLHDMALGSTNDYGGNFFDTWLTYFSAYSWVISGVGTSSEDLGGSDDIYHFTIETNIGFYQYTYPSVMLFPTFYLTSDIKIASGDGTESDPFILEI